MTKWVCSVCGYVYEGEKAPEACPVCKAPADKFVKQDGEMSWAAEHVVDPRRSARELRGRGQRGRHVSGDGARRASRRISGNRFIL